MLFFGNFYTLVRKYYACMIPYRVMVRIFRCLYFEVLDAEILNAASSILRPLNMIYIDICTAVVVVLHNFLNIYQ